jgi:DNA-binding NtrC family response regulator
MKKARPRRKSERLQQKTAGAGTRTASAPLTRRRILVVDNDLEDLLLYSAILQHEGYEVRSIASHKEAAGCIGREKFDLIIVSQGTAAFEGRSVLARAFERNQRVPVIVLSRSWDTDYCLEALRMGAADCRVKPAAACEVAELAGRHLGLSRTRAA